MEDSPYKVYLEYLLGTKGQGVKVTLHRADAPDLRGELAEVEERGCFISQPGSRPDSVLRVFVAHENIRGVVCEEWDLENIK